MKLRPCLFALALVAPTLLTASSRTDAVLLKGNAIVHDGVRMSATGGASLLCGDTRVIADEIVYDSQTNSLKCTGAVTIQAGGLSIEAQTVTVNVQGKRIFSLANGNITPGPYPIDVNVGIPIAPGARFEASYPKTETQLRPR
jgi:lipopolysaccharide assembly outer membrane protein LptD (OstA)